MTDPILSAYQDAVLAARDRGFALGRANVRLVEQAFRDAIRQLTLQMTDPNPLTAERAASLRRQLIATLEQLETKVAQATARGVTLTVEDVVQIHQDAISSIVTRALGSSQAVTIAARLDVVATRAASILASIRPARTFQTLVRRHLLDAAPELDRLLVSAVARGQSSRNLAQDIIALLQSRTPPDMRPSDVAGMRSLRYDATRIARSEIMNSLREANAQSMAASGLVLASKWQLSGSHPEEDVCDLIAGADLYGFGPGFYPPDRWPLAAHPHDQCYAGAVKMREPKDWVKPPPEAPDMAMNPAEVDTPAGWSDAYTEAQVNAFVSSVHRNPPVRRRRAA